MRIKTFSCVRCGIPVCERGSLCMDCVTVLPRAEAQSWRTTPHHREARP